MRGILPQVAIALATALLPAGGCGDDGETALVLEIHSPLEVPAEVDVLSIEAEGTDSGALLQTSLTLQAPFPHTYAIFPDGNQGEAVEVEVIGWKDGLPVERAQLQTRFLEGEVREVPVHLGVLGDGGRPDGGDGGARLDGGMSPDGGPRDAATDGAAPGEDGGAGDGGGGLS